MCLFLGSHLLTFVPRCGDGVQELREKCRATSPRAADRDLFVRKRTGRAFSRHWQAKDPCLALCCQIERWPEWDDSGGINFGVRHVIMTLDMIEINRLGDTGLLIQVHKITLEVRVIDNAADVALEVTMVDDVKPDEGAEKAPVGFDDATVEQVPAFREARLQFIECFKEFSARDLVRPLARGEPGLVNAVVDVLVEKIGKLRVFGL